MGKGGYSFGALVSRFGVRRGWGTILFGPPFIFYKSLALSLGLFFFQVKERSGSFTFRQEELIKGNSLTLR